MVGPRNRVLRLICSIGARYDVAYAAPTRTTSKSLDDQDSTEDNGSTSKAARNEGRLDRWLDFVVQLSGSQFVFFVILATVLAWAFMGIKFGKDTDWQVGISDGQAILNLVFDSFLMRQQLNTYRQRLVVACCLRSRTTSHKRMLGALARAGIPDRMALLQSPESRMSEAHVDLPKETLLGRFSTQVSHYLGHVVTLVGFWVCIFVWIGFGPYCGWSSDWLLYINSSTSALMVFMLAFLANIRERHSSYSSRCTDLVYASDAVLESKLRAATDDMIPNTMITIPAPAVGKIQRCIDFYADLVGTLLGVALLVLVLAIWAAIGPAMHFDSNWWLLIGTYAGLIGMNDGFVLRNVDHKISGYQEAEFDQQLDDDKEMFALAGLPLRAQSREFDKSLSYRISSRMGNILSHELTVLAGVFLIVALVTVSSAMEWSITGQLLSNVPPSIIESFFTLILLTGHNIGEEKRRADFDNIYMRRLELIQYVGRVLGHLESK